MSGASVARTAPPGVNPSAGRRVVRTRSSPVASTVPTTPVSLSAAQAVIEACVQRATKLGVPMNIAVVDAGANLVAFARMDGAWLGSVEIAKNKAYTARAFDMTTKDLAKLASPAPRRSASPTRPTTASPSSRAAFPSTWASRSSAPSG